MLNGLAGYLFGGRSENGISPSVDNGRRSPAGRDEEDGWILVDNEPELDIVALPSSTESSGSVSPVTTIEALGWNLTPPPCFTISQQQHEQQQQQLSDGQKTVVDKQSPSENRPSGTVAKLALTPRGRRDDGQPVPPMEISVFENLLIEHPSMSVYRRRPGVPPTSGSDDGAGVKGGQRRGNKCRWPLIAATTTPLSITQGAPTTPTPLDDDDVVDQSATPIVAPPSAGGVRRSVVDDFMHFFGGATCRRDVWRAATAAQQRVERAAKGRDCGTNRMRRQSTTNAATTADAAKVVQRKRRMRKQSARSNDRKCQ